MGSPNVLCLVLDCLRVDSITEEDAPDIYQLANNTLSFDRCVTPANWSLPAHASLFMGEWPHNHGYYHREHHLENTPLVDKLAVDGHKTVGVTANIYASISHGFDDNWEVVADSRDKVVAYQEENTVDVSVVPDRLREACKDAVNNFPRVNTELNTDLSGTIKKQLRLGYV